MQHSSFTASIRGGAVALVALAALCVSCGADPAPQPLPGASDAVATVPTSAAEAAEAAASADAAAGVTTPPAGPDPTPGAEKVRDAFAGLQATLDDSCATSGCAYFLGRVHDELLRLDRAMKADPKGPGHFPRPIELIARLEAELGGDSSFENLKKHETLLVGTRDKINTWMQDHPDDYR
ncbi:hypothetical protein ABZV60_24370 [Streptomyces sp. NPDC004787]|uniref:hypothetical protein n=1 Tax=Streptomyces sp. NPDC004787 TaxID=3154291 RepID=UPI0033AAABC5